VGGEGPSSLGRACHGAANMAGNRCFRTSSFVRLYSMLHNNVGTLFSGTFYKNVHNIKLRLSGMRRVEYWELSYVSAKIVDAILRANMNRWV
jgi:hypothetical protein